MTDPFSYQEGGDHYQGLAIQPIDFIMKNGLDHCEGSIVKYISRYKRKGNPRRDLLKAKQYIDFLLTRYPEESNDGRDSREPREYHLEGRRPHDTGRGKHSLDGPGG